MRDVRGVFAAFFLAAVGAVALLVGAFLARRRGRAARAGPLGGASRGPAS